MADEEFGKNPAIKNTVRQVLYNKTRTRVRNCELITLQLHTRVFRLQHKGCGEMVSKKKNL